jgi:hypothetical protein
MEMLHDEVLVKAETDMLMVPMLHHKAQMSSQK